MLLERMQKDIIVYKDRPFMSHNFILMPDKPVCKDTITFRFLLILYLYLIRKTIQMILVTNQY